jgi:hypothetical protein
MEWIRMPRINYLICLCTVSTLAAFSQNAARNPETSGGQYLKRATVSQSAGMVRVDANSPRPLEQTLDALLEKYGWVVDYEDPQYVSRLDFVDAPDETEHTPVPAGGDFSVQFPATAPEEEKTLRIVIDAYNRSRNPGQFELRHSNQGQFYVVGTAAHDEKGAIVQQQALFDFPLTLSTEERTIAETVDLICKAVGKQSHIPVVLGVFPRSLLRSTLVKAGGVNVSARDILQQCLAASRRRLYWRLLFDPASKGYFLNIHSLPRA